MTASAPPVERPVAAARLGAIHILLGVQTVVVLLGSLNRLTSLNAGYVAPNQFLRWIEIHNMLTLPLVSILAYYLLKKHLEASRPATSARAQLALNLVFLAGIYLLGASYGTHEVTNYLHIRFCPDSDTSLLCRIIAYNDDDFSHYVFFTAFVLISAALMAFQLVFPHNARLAKGDISLLILNGAFIGLGVFANLGFEVIGLDLYVVALLAVLAFGLLWRRGAQPLLVYYCTAYGLGLVLTAAYKLFVG
jgi:hypothetical protein